MHIRHLLKAKKASYIYTRQQRQKNAQPRNGMFRDKFNTAILAKLLRCWCTMCIGMLLTAPPVCVRHPQLQVNYTKPISILMSCWWMSDNQTSGCSVLLVDVLSFGRCILTAPSGTNPCQQVNALLSDCMRNWCLQAVDKLGVKI